ncbi:MAG TPA: WD40 repeat domain-containing protein [Anaeromyxobacteraceae bacterium]|nr:WD40 repeat domain-containing protein [Anaeromyxobacteraceae bacterium]
MGVSAARQEALARAVWILLASGAAALLAASCSGTATSQAGAGKASSGDGGAISAEPGDAGPDAGPSSGADAGMPDGGSGSGGPGPWPTTNEMFGGAQGIKESPVVGMSTDESQNLWVATPSALYLMKPGATTFRRYTSSDGLHLADNPVVYNEDYCGGARGVHGSADGNGISTIVGGATGEVFVGYHGVLAIAGDCSDPPDQRHSGKLDRVRLRSDDTLEVKRFDMASTGMGLLYWHNRTVYRLLYDHKIHPHTLYVGTDHGVDMMHPDDYRDPAPGEWTGISIQQWMSDHLHVQICFDNDPVCVSGGEGNARMGDWRGLAISPDGDLWHAGRWSAGKIAWVDDLHEWSFRRGAQAYAEAFGWNGIPPVFPVPQLGDVVSLSAVAVAADGTAWFASSYFYGNGPAVPAPGSGLGIAHYLGGGRFEYLQPSDAGIAEQDVQDMVALPDGRLVLAGANSGLVFFDPVTRAHSSLRAGQGIPDDRVVQLELDTMVTPPALHVSTVGGAATLRSFP